MSEQNNSKNTGSVFVRSVVSNSLLGKEELSTYGKKIQELKKEAEKIAPNGVLNIFLSDEKEKYYQFDKLVYNLSLSKNIYNERAFMKDPELAKEFAKIAESIRNINNVIDKRKKKNKLKKGGQTNEKRV